MLRSGFFILTILLLGLIRLFSLGLLEYPIHAGSQPVVATFYGLLSDCLLDA